MSVYGFHNHVCVQTWRHCGFTKMADIYLGHTAGSTAEEGRKGGEVFG